MRLAFVIARMIGCVALLAGALSAQKKDPVQWSLSADVISAPAGTTVPLRFSATIQLGWHIYSLTIPKTREGPAATVAKIVANPAVESFSVYQPKPLRKLDKTISLDTEMFEEAVSFWMPVKLASNASGAVEIVAEARYSACDDRQCLVPVTKRASATVNIDASAVAPAAFVVPAGHVDINDKAAVAAMAVGTPVKADEGLGAFALTAFGFGLLAIFTPCVFPMIPITVSFFLNQRGGILQAVVFWLGIIGLFCGLALAMTAILGPFGVVQMSSNPWVNGFIAVVFGIFAVSLLGAFEISLPSGLLTKMDRASRREGYLGTLLMGLTFSLTSFACVGPFVGPLLASSVQSHSLTQPMVGMASFATGLASPFFFLAAFPSYLKKLPRSGGWLARVKVVMGFVLLAIMLKYISNIDQVLRTGFLTRERFLAAWFVLFAMAGLYLLGLLRLEGVEPDEPLGVGRLLTAGALLIFAFSLLPGMFGAPLGELDAYVPIAGSSVSLNGSSAPTGPAWMKDQYREALALGREQNKLVLVNFTGYACTNCHWMKANMFPKPEIAAALNEFIRVDLYIDGGDVSSAENQALEEQKFQTVSMPFYALMDANESVVATFSGSTRDVQEYLTFLQKRPI
ncbi:MAG: cytochrome c biogenesis protein CcdA [Acidobacteriota bacterium]